MYRMHSRRTDSGTARVFSGRPASRIDAAPHCLTLLIAALFAGQPLIVPAAENIIWPGGTLGTDPVWSVPDSLFPSPASLSRNTVTIGGGPAIPGLVLGGAAVAANPPGEVSGNRVFLSAGQVSMDIVGGYSNSGAVVRNVVEITGGTVGTIVYGGYSGSGAATGNTVNFSGGTAGAIGGGFSLNGAAAGNTVNISGGTVNGDVYGGYDFAGTATGNTVNISGNPWFSFANTSLHGGSGVSFTGNTLNFSASPVDVAMVGNFEHYNFTLDYTSRALPLINASGGISLGSGGASSVIKVAGVRPSGLTLRQHDTFVLMQAAGGITSAGGASSWTGAFRQGSQFCDVKVSIAGTQVIATITGVRSLSAAATPVRTGRDPHGLAPARGHDALISAVYSPAGVRHPARNAERPGE